MADRGTRLATQVTAALSGTDPVPEVAACVEASDLEDALVRDGPFHVLLAGPALATASGLARLRAVGEDLPEVSVVLAFARRPEANLRALVQVGAVDLLQLPVDDGELAAAVVRAAGMAREAVTEAAEDEYGELDGCARDRRDGDEPGIDVESEPGPQHERASRPQPDPVREGGGGIVTVLSATGSTGRTTIATNLAALLATVHGATVCLVDLDLRFGGVAAAMGLRPEAAIDDLSEGAPVDDEALARVITRHPCGVDVLAAPTDPAAADAVTPEQVDAVLAGAQRDYGWVVCDTPPALTDLVLGAVERSDHLVVVSLTDRVGRRDLRTFLDRLRRMQVPASRVHLVFNRVDEHDPGTLPEAARIPEHPLAGPAASGGTPLTAGASGVEAPGLAESFAAAFVGFLPTPPPAPPPSAEASPATTEPPERPPRRRRLRRRRA